MIRRLVPEDYYKGYLDLLNQLTVTNTFVSYLDFFNQLNNINSDIFVIELDNKIVASGSILIERKFIRDFRSVGHIEDIVVDKNYRSKGLGKQIINYLTQYAKDNGCYKVILDCSKENVEFYTKCGYIDKGVCMGLYF